MISLHQCRFFAAASLALGLVTAQAWAQGARPADPAQGARWGAGLGITSKTSPYKGVGSETQVLPAVVFENTYVRWLGPTLDLKLPSSGPLSYALTAKYADNGYTASDAAALQGMAERKDGFWLGAKLRWNTPWLALTAGLLGDASNHSGGQQLSLEASKGFMVGRGMRLEPRLGLTRLDSAYVDHFYGVRAGEATAGRAAYAGPSTVNTELGLRLNAQLAPRQGLMVDFRHTLLGSGIQNSPLVDTNGTSALFVAYLYQF